MDWLSHLLDMIPVTGQLEVRCLYGIPWRVAYEPSKTGEIPFHVVLGGTAILEDPDGGDPLQLGAGDIVLLPHGSAHVLHDGSGAPPAPVLERRNQNLTIRENAEAGDRLDMLCGRFILAPEHERIIRGYILSTLVVVRGARGDVAGRSTTLAQLASLVGLMQTESTADSLGGRAMLNALSAALLTLTLRHAIDSSEAPAGLLALAAHPRLAPALNAMVSAPARAWTLPELANLCNMSRATMARHFRERLGRSAADLLTDIRITLAANELKKPSVSIEGVAESVGYQSARAFRLVLKQRIGMSPAEWRRASASQDLSRPNTVRLWHKAPESTRYVGIGWLGSGSRRPDDLGRAIRGHARRRVVVE
ncbi:cupin domain-containing protein [Variovorax sp. LjRoot175]|uniref:cupin domain-containing protein n=1 Tax=Variovorax sp. LjRoot175 TaxID=3342276 RepID=UPI003F512B76